MGTHGTLGGEPVTLIGTQATLDNWQNVQSRRNCSLRQRYRSTSYQDIANYRDYTLPPPTVPLLEYIDYNNYVLLFGHTPEPIEEKKIGAWFVAIHVGSSRTLELMA
jgi:hypothetical protein